MSGVKVFNQKIPLEKFSLWHEIFIQNNGRYLSNPYAVGDNMIVSYEPGNYEALNAAWARAATPIKEVKREKKKIFSVSKAFMSRFFNLYKP